MQLIDSIGLEEISFNKITQKFNEITQPIKYIMQLYISSYENV